VPLPVTKGEFNRLGDRLIADATPSEADLQALAAVLPAYQETLERIKVQLHDLGYAPTGRVKTTTTMTDKLRRTHGMELSRMQDIAGARIVVHNLAAQDEAKDKISEFYTAQGCPLRMVDRRVDPRFGYKAIHLVPRIDGLLVEIQVRTELQDTWAQIVERSADRWGRGIRYGEEPENPDAAVRSGNEVFSRRGLLEVLMSLSDVITDIDQLRLRRDTELLAVENFRPTPISELYARGDPQKLESRIPPEVASSLAPVIDVLARHQDELDEEGRELFAAGTDITGVQGTRVIEIAYPLIKAEVTARATTIAGVEQKLQAILQLIADAEDEGV
jgi:ppGpp synthetase/RelA/SpoT-type nucleotidyltranferase